MFNLFTRRDALKATLATGAGMMISSSNSFSKSWTDASSATKPKRTGGFRFAHLTDMHVQPERHSGEGYAAALRSLDQLNPKPQIIITGGDHVMDSFASSPDRCKTEWDLYTQLMHEHVTLPVFPVLGNHDICGWGDEKKFPPMTDGFGKAKALLQLSLRNPSYSFDAGDWRFIVLDSVMQRGDSYLGSLGPEQTAWLKEELERTGKSRPICIISHLPILSVCVYFDGDRLRETFWHVPDAWMHRDAIEITNLIEPYNVPLLLSGHIHMLDRCEYRGKTYISDGSVCGNWWKGAYHDCPEGYGVIDIWPDGSFEHQYVTYGWRAEKSE